MQLGEFLKKQQLQKISKMRQNHQTTAKKQDKATESTLMKRRQKLHMSIPQLSMITGINQATLKRWETNGMTQDDSIAQINKYAKAMHLNLQKLVQHIPE